MPPMSPAPKDLRPELIRKIESLSEEDLHLVHEVLLHTEKERLWRGLSSEMAIEHEAGKFERLPELIREVRAELKRA